MRSRLRVLVLVAPLLLTLGWGLIPGSLVATADQPPGVAEDKGAAGWTTAVTPKPLSEHVKKGLAWLAEHQLPNGGWGQGEESANMGGGEAYRDKADVADTCIAALALLRSGSTPREGLYRDAVARAVRFVRAEVEASDTQSLSVSTIQGTRVQMKLGPNIDTFLASLLLAEVKGRMPDDAGNASVNVALNKVLDKIKKNQKADGSWDNQQGWAPILAQSIGGKGLNRAKQAGAMVPEELLARTESFAKAQFALSTVSAPVAVIGPTVVSASRVDQVEGRTEPVFAGKSGGMARSSAGAGSAGVELYDRAASVGVLQDSVNTNATREPELKAVAQNSKDEAERGKARDELRRIGDAKKVNREAQAALLGRLDDAQFVSGFGSNGGEEFLSYMNISESLVVKGGPEWKRWDDAMTSNLDRIQNRDGSWSGHHCITGRTFCTSSALLVLQADRTPVPVKTGTETQ